MYKKVIGLSIIGLFVALVLLFAKGLTSDPGELDNVTVENPVPSFSLPTLFSEKIIDNSDFVTDKSYYLMNFWGSWCPSCYDEHPLLMELSKDHTFYGVNWKDETDNAQKFINERGNPFAEIVVDDNSVLAIGMGVYGAPETFLIKKDGTIIYRLAKPLDMGLWNAEFIPRINQLEAGK